MIFLHLPEFGDDLELLNRVLHQEPVGAGVLREPEVQLAGGAPLGAGLEEKRALPCRDEAVLADELVGGPVLQGEVELQIAVVLFDEGVRRGSITLDLRR